MDTENQETSSNVEGKEHVQRPKRRRNVTSYCDTKTRRTKSSSVLNAEDNNCSLSPNYSENLKQYPTHGTKLKSCSDLLTERKNETRHENENHLAELQRLKQQVTAKRSSSASDTECGTINFPCQEKQEKNCKKSSRHSLVSIPKQLNGDNSNTKLEETNFCRQLMKLEKINKDVSLDSTIGKTDDVEVEDTASSTTKQTSCRRGRKRKQTAEQETEVGKVGNKSSDPEDSKVRKFRTRSKSVLDIDRNDSLNEPLPISHNDYREMCTSTPIVKKSRGKRKELVNRSERYLSNISTTLPDSGVLSEMIIPLEASSFSVSSPAPIPVSKSDLSEPNDALELYSTLPTSGKSQESSLFFSSDASQDKSCFSDSADLCLAGIDQSVDSDSDEDLPLGFTPVKLDRSFSVNDVVWVKWKQWPYLPALVKQVYKQKKRLTLAVFGKNGLQENFTMSYYNQDSIIRYWHPKKAEILAGAMSLSHEDRQQFNDSVAAVEKFLFVGSSLIDDTSLSEPGSCDQPDVNNTTDCMDSSMMDATENMHEDKDNLDNVSSCENENKCLNRKNGKNRNVACESAEKIRISSQDPTPKQKLEEKAKSVNESLSMKGVIRKQKRSEQTKPLSDFMKSNAMKKYLAKIYKGEIESTLHDRFNSGSRKERVQLKHHGFGPIDDQDQIQTVLDVFLEWLQELDPKPDTKINYMIDVWFPEAVVYALRKKKQYSVKRAWTVYEKGVPRTKAELKNYFPDYVCNDKKRRFKSLRTFVEIDEETAQEQV